MKKKIAACFFLLCSIAVISVSAQQKDAPAAKGRVFVINAPVTNIEDFKQLVKQAEVLKPFGTVQVSVSTLADKSWHEIPKQGSSWHEYASANPTPFKFFPDKKAEPFIPSDFIKKNRQLLLEKTKILRQNGMEAAFLGYEPNFLPAAFFDANPGMMGPRVDHPRRSTEKAFAPCIHVKETQEMYASMMAEMLKQAPEITSFGFKTNDAGAGICWADWLYSGANGPSACKDQTMGQRVKLLLETFLEGAKRAGRPLSIYVDEGSSNFSEAERRDIEANLPPNCYFRSRNDRQIINIGGTLASLYPVTGIINPIGLVNSAKRIKNAENSTVFIGFRAAYDRGAEPLYITAFILQTIASQLTAAATKGDIENRTHLLQLCEGWVGKDQAAALLETLYQLEEASSYKASTFPRVHSLYWGVTMRLINRPLVLAPQLLSAEEESYFLKQIFNTNLNEARMDYMDLHGGRSAIPSGVVDNYVRRINRIAERLESIKTAGSKPEIFQRMGTALRIHASIMRSCGNFAAAQVIRDRNRDSIYGQPLNVIPAKEFDWSGHPDFIPFNNIMRDELDNTVELIQILEKGGMERVITAKDPRYEDHFILGPGLLEQLRLKRTIMLRHWQDVQLYLHSPLK
ncbi:MAG: hypothetical protein NVV59_20120 [Chitinophagaceae bacterium]|nr:hypothetical protein [Chitinophagaceae bacterium]